MDNVPVLYSAGPCSVCAEMSEAFFVKRVPQGSLFFVCVACGIGWETPPQALVVDSIDPVELLSPGGITLPTLKDIQDANLEALIEKEVRDDAWLSLMSPWIVPGSAGR
jgi:hypothetical protein